MREGAAGRFRASLAAALILAAAPGRGQAATPEEVFDRGNEAYEQGRFEEAAEAYRTVLRYGIADARVEYNLGNALFKLGRLGQAILHYERARRLAPGDPDIEANLGLAASRCLDKVEPADTAAVVRWLRAAQDRAGQDAHALAFLVLVWAACAVAAAGMSRRGAFTAAKGWTLAALGGLLAAVGASWWTTRLRAEAANRAVVLARVVQVLAGPGGNNATLFTVHEGLRVDIRSERPGWVQVSLPNGVSGWLPRDALERI